MSETGTVSKSGNAAVRCVRYGSKIGCHFWNPTTGKTLGFSDYSADGLTPAKIESTAADEWEQMLAKYAAEERIPSPAAIRLSDVRHNQRVSLGELVKRIARADVTAVTVSDWERGTAYPSEAQAAMWVASLGMQNEGFRYEEFLKP